MTLGCFTFCFGLATRFAFAKHPESKGIYIAEYLLVVLSPCAFIAGTYVVLGRLARYLRADQYLLIRPSRVTLTFVLSDIVTFVIQAIGGTVAIATEDPDKIKLGGNLFKAGIILQFVSFAFFTMLLIVFTTRVYKNERAIWTADKDAGKKWSHDWRALLGVMFVACVTILIRSAYRTAEAAEGLHGRLSTTEWMFYAFDTLPLFICIATYVPFWPGRFIPSVDAHIGPNEKEMQLEAMDPSENASRNRPVNA
ncbi:RTA1 like protein [Exidia glandulosa HHB12029]|uniref:RTA1 like protein n=1 Tax=Exidia glandulosa HHB12029 TaxID=1314781 RepID=A0A165ER02_EXIGL|nr:RTA1 like protein [Exidia glandulosa HHB12029]